EANPASSFAGVHDRDRRPGGERGDRGAARAGDLYLRWRLAVRRAVPSLCWDGAAGTARRDGETARWSPRWTVAAGLCAVDSGHQRGAGTVQPASGLSDGRRTSAAQLAGDGHALRAGDALGPAN